MEWRRYEIKYSSKKLKEILKRREDLIKQYRSIESGGKLLSRSLPEEIVEIPYDGPLKILAFSDYRLHNLNTLLKFIETLNEKPDLIIYAGGSLWRFTRPKPESLRSKCLIHQGIPHDYLPEYDFITYGGDSQLIWRIPKKFAANLDEKHLKQRLAMVVELAKDLKQMIMSRSRTEDYLSSLMELISKKYAMFDVIPVSEETLYRKYAIIDKYAETEVLSLHVFKLFNDRIARDSLLSVLVLASVDEIDSLLLKKIYEDESFICFHVARAGHDHNMLELLAKKSQFGLVVVAGDDDVEEHANLYIDGEKVFNAEKTWIKVGRFLIVGLEGATAGIGALADHYSEADTRLRLELAKDFANDGTELIVVSHAPPRGVLDRELHYGNVNVGSTALRDFVEENSQKIPLVICGHAENLGGRFEKLQDTLVVNVSSPNDIYSKVNISLIDVDEHGHVDIKFYKLPSVVDEIFESGAGEEVLRRLKAGLGLSDSEAHLFINMFEKYGRRFLEDLHMMAKLKFRYGFSWDNVFRLYMRGVVSLEQISDEIVEDVMKDSYGIHKTHLMRAYAKIVREREKGNTYLLTRIPLEDKIMLIDAEYVPEKGSIKPVLYGFLDATTGELKQFWFYETDKLVEYLNSKADYLFTYWGGADKKLLEMLGFRVRFLNLLYQVQISLIAPIETTDLKSVHDALCGHKNEEWWQRNFYDMDGLTKLMLCRQVLGDLNDLEARESLANANKADLLALKYIVDKLRKLQTK
jgi:Icc-related predicted phosphoesterase